MEEQVGVITTYSCLVLLSGSLFYTSLLEFWNNGILVIWKTH